ncbi:unnamed protein product, partial [Allacma fusca]
FDEEQSGTANVSSILLEYELNDLNASLRSLDETSRKRSHEASRGALEKKNVKETDALKMKVERVEVRVFSSSEWPEAFSLFEEALVSVEINFMQRSSLHPGQQRFLVQSSENIHSGATSPSRTSRSGRRCVYFRKDVQVNITRV